MMVCVHAAIGAALGACLGNRSTAFVSGIASHLICDLLPHKDYDLKVEATLAVMMFTYIGKRYGIDSLQFIGAVGAVLPDAENALAVMGVIPKTKMVFPTHNEECNWYIGHGPVVEGPLSQIIITAIATAIMNCRK